MLLIQILCGSSMEWAAQYRVTYIVWMSLICWTEGGHFVLFPTVFRAMYGDQATQLYSVMFTFTGLSNLLQLIVVSSRLGTEFEVVFKVGAYLSVFSLLLLIVVFKERPEPDTFKTKASHLHKLLPSAVD